MRAVLMMGIGGLDVLRVGEVADPKAGPGEVVVDIRAASVNGADAKVRAGLTKYEHISFPHILGRDFSGVVSAAGECADLEVGEHVFGVCVRGTDGGYAEKIAIASSILARKPPALDHAEAAALALTGLTAIYGLEDVGQLRPGQEILVQGGAGGVGSFAVQLAKHLGAVVTATASARNHDYVKSLGADGVIDYRQSDFTALGERYDVVYDTVGGDVQRRSAAVLKPGGRLIYCAPGPETKSPSRSDIEIVNPAVVRDRGHLDRISDLVAAGAIRLPTITRFPLEGAIEAQRISETRHLQGKLVLEMR
jgi:NADPH:quinone reductase-like Zn-dependent oxidoreductase